MHYEIWVYLFFRKILFRVRRYTIQMQKKNLIHAVQKYSIVSLPRVSKNWYYFIVFVMNNVKKKQ